MGDPSSKGELDMRRFKRFLFFFSSLLLCLLAVFLILVFTGLYIGNRGLPRAWVDTLCEDISTDKISVRADRIRFSLDQGIRIDRPTVLYDGGERNWELLLSAEEIQTKLSFKFSSPWIKQIDEMRISGIRFPGIPDSMRNAPPSEPTSPTLPNLAPFRLILENPMILGIHAKSLTGLANVDTNGISVRDALVTWYGNDCPKGVRGWVDLDFSTRLVTTDIRGQALPAYIVPLMAKNVLDAPSVEVELNAFQSVRPPVEAGAYIAVNIDTCDFSVYLDVDAGSCTYKGIPVQSLKGVLSAGDTNDFTTLTVGPLKAQSDTGPLSGWLRYQQKDRTLEFDADSKMDLPYIFTMIELLNNGELDSIHCTQAPQMIAKGLVSVDAETGQTNRITGKVSLPEGSILNLKIKNAQADFTMDGYSARFHHVNGTALHGGGISGEVTFHFPRFDPDQTTFSTTSHLQSVDLIDLASAVNVTNERIGQVTGGLHISGAINTNVLSSLNGSGSLKISNGLLNRFPLFAGFTDFLAKHVPGVSLLVDQSEGSFSFTIKDGILKSDSFLLEGRFFSISGRGTYDFAKDDLNFMVRANIFRKESIVGKITRIVTTPLTSMLFEFRVFGPIDKATWEYHSVVDKVKGVFSPTPKP